MNTRDAGRGMKESSGIDSCDGAEVYDVVVAGGAIGGASTALLLRRSNPDLRVLIVEQDESFPHKVGEATVEVSGFFLEHVLQLGDHLFREHLPKHGLRYWFASRPDDTLENMGEVGPMAAPHVPSFQLDRSKLDEHVLGLAVAEGCDLLRPARAKIFHDEWPNSRVEIEHLNGDRTSRTVTCRWFVDGTGRRTFLARQKGLLERFKEHETSATWSRWTGVLDLDSREFMGPPEKPKIPRLRAQRRLATNHFVGRGWWCWVIPLSNGKTSVGLVHDKRLIDPGAGIGPMGLETGTTTTDAIAQGFSGGEASEDEREGENRLNAKQRFERFVRAQPGLKQMLADAEMCDDCTSYAFLSYRSKEYMGAGWALVGDAAGFLDPYYSPGLDHLGISVVATVHLLGEELRGGLDDAELPERVAAHNKAFAVSYRRWYEALYEDKYEILGDAQLVTASFLVETSMYYLGVVTPILRNLEALRNPVFGAPLPQSKIAARIARAFRRRMVRLARLRREKGLYGKKNSEIRYYPAGFGLGWRVWPTMLKGIGIWLRCEVQQVFGGR